MNRVTLTISILKPFITMVGDEKIVTNFFGEVRQGVVVGGEIFPLLLKNNF